jgi:hypothetical protein
MRFERDEDDILWPEIRGTIGRPDRRLDESLRRLKAQALVLDRRQVVAARDDADTSTPSTRAR